jgi:RNA polymerase sigma-70 factor (ECF subfamily)
LTDENPASLFQEWLAQHQAAVLKIARAYTLTPEDCQDLAQQIVLEAWRSLPSFQGRASPSTWFYRVALNTALTWNRKDRLRRTRQQPLVKAEDVATANPSTTDHVEQRELVERLYAAIHQLPKGDAALILLYLDDLSYRDMADILGISETNVGVKLNRAKKALSLLMKETSNE